ncbi:MAG TPA: peptidoglycan DD-metalloendopeptidase family protein [Candidatus Dormibacteraeota bacterium]
MYRRLALATATLALLAAASTGVAAANPSSPAPAPENPYKAPVHPNVHPDDQLTIVNPPASRSGVRTATGVTTVAPFLTRPYWGPRSVNSVFDHCLSNGYYVADGKICEEDGTVALKSNGIDPTFNLGYAVTPGKTDYLYYDGHNGWDLGLSMDTPVIAAADGVVTYAGWDSYGWGNTVLINHGNGFSTRYAHLDSIAVALNQTVSRGQQIGLSGTTGNSTGPHLHFGVYRNDMTLSNGDMVAIDPWGWQATGAADPWPYDEGDLWINGNPTDPAPSAPAGVTAAVQCGGVDVSWTAPAYNGGDGISSYTITATPGGATEVVDATRTSALFPGLTPTTAYTFTVAASSTAGTGPASTATTAVTAPATSVTDDSCHLYVMSGYGAIHPAGISPTLADGVNFGWDIARSFALLSDSTGGYVLDGWGGIHPVGSAPPVALPAYWQGWDIARSIALAPWATASSPAGWVLDAWGGIHAFGGAPAIKSPGYWPGWDIARQLVIEPDSTPGSVSGYMLDGWGGLHPFGKAVAVSSAYWHGWDIVHGLTLLPTSTTSAPAGYTLDGWGGVHPFGGAPAVQISGYWHGWDIARGITAWSAGTSAQPGGWVLDGYGGLHPFGSAAAEGVSAYWPGWDIARALGGNGENGRGQPAG